MKTFFKDLYLYNHQCNEELIVSFEVNDQSNEPKSLELFSHTLNAHHIWNSRIFGIERRLEVWQIHNFEKMGQINDECLLNSIQIIEEYDFELAIKYATTKGDPMENTVRNILFHVINHSTYHRGQIAMLMRNHGLNPIPSDFVHKFKKSN